MNQTVKIACLMCHNPGVYAVLLGSGVSRSARIPTGWEITETLIRRVAQAMDKSEPDDLTAWYREHIAGAEPNYSVLLEKLPNTPAERRGILKSFFEPTEDERERGLKEPTPAHKSIAKLVAGGFIRAIITTNFDRLMERALEAEGVSPTIISTSDGIRGAEPLTHQKCVILKLHGDYQDERIKNTPDELSEYDEDTKRYLDRILDEFGLIISGWSGEWDLALRRAIEGCPSRRYTIFWTTRADLKPEVQALAESRKAEMVTINDADSFFRDVAEKVFVIHESRQDDPETIAVKHALLKKYIAEPKYRVRLSDLLKKERDEIVKLHTAKLAQPDDTETKAESPKRKRLKDYDVATGTLNRLILDATRWGEEVHDDIIKQAIISLIPAESPQGIGPGYLMIYPAAHLMIYPAAQVFYHAVAGCIMGENFRLLKRLTEMRFRFLGRPDNAIPKLTTCNCIDLGCQKELSDYPTHHFPFSTHFLDIMRPLLKENVPDAEEFYFNLEIWLALIELDKHEHSNSTDACWGLPFGNFLFRYQDPVETLIFTEARLQGDDWAPFRAGYFNKSFSRLETVYEVLKKRARAKQEMLS